MAIREFKLSELKLDQENIRTGPVASQREAIQAIIAEREPHKLINLARDVMSNGLSPGEPIWVTADQEDAGRFIVLEGNRRIASLKMMDSPQLASGTVVAGAFADLGKDFAKRPIRTITAQEFADRADAKR